MWFIISIINCGTYEVPRSLGVVTHFNTHTEKEREKGLQKEERVEEEDFEDFNFFFF